MKLEDFKLTEQDFETIMEALEVHAEERKNPFSGFMEVLSHSHHRMSEDAVERKLKEIRNKETNENKLKKERIRLLQGKLLMIKQEMQEKNILRNVGDILDKDSE